MWKPTSTLSKVLLGVALSAFTLMAQTASLTGTVKDPAGSSIPDANLTLTNNDTGIAVKSRSNADGDFQFSFVKPGSYSIKAVQPGFKTYVQNDVVLAVDQRSRLDVVMQLGEESTMITVEATPTGVETETSSVGEVVSNKKIV